MAISGVDDFRPDFSERWQHGGWYVSNVTYPSGAIGCVSNNYEDKLWRMACHCPELTFTTRADAAKAEKVYVDGLHREAAMLAALERAKGFVDSWSKKLGDWDIVDQNAINAINAAIRDTKGGA